MANDKGGIVAEIERRFNLPSLSRTAEILKNFPDTGRLKMLKQTLEVAERVSNTAIDLEQVLGLIKAINEIPTEKLVLFEKILKKLEKLIKLAPPEIMDFIKELKE